MRGKQLGVFGIAVLALSLLGGVVAGRQQSVSEKKPPSLPEGEGKRILLSACTSCHGLGEVMARRTDARGWEDVVSDMVARGTSLLPGEFETLVQYLAQHFGPPININLLDEEELASQLSIERSLAAAIVRYRERQGPFRRVADVLNVEGMTEEIFERIREKITVGSPHGHRRDGR